MDQMANWVRFADTKATILTAGLGVVLTVLMTNAKTIAEALRQGCAATYVTGTLATIAALAVCWTLFWLVRAVAPQSGAPNRAINRFAWPTLSGVHVADLAAHASIKPASEDAWQQVLDLAALAERKFRACRQAVRGFAVLVVVGVACVAAAIAFVG